MSALNFGPEWLKKLSLPTTTGNITGTTTTMSTPVSTTTSTDASPTTTSSPFHYTKQQILEIFKPAKRPIDFNVVAGVVREEAGEPVGWKEIGEEEAKVRAHTSWNPENKRKEYHGNAATPGKYSQSTSRTHTPNRPNHWSHNDEHSGPRERSRTQDKEDMWDDPNTYEGAGFDNGKFTTVSNRKQVNNRGDRGVRKPVREVATEQELLLKIIKQQSRPQQRPVSSENTYSRSSYGKSRGVDDIGSQSNPVSAHFENEPPSWRDSADSKAVDQTRSSLGLNIDRHQNGEMSLQDRGPTNHLEHSVEPESDTWTYKDPDGNVQGPFTGREMKDWYMGGYFVDELPLKRAGDIGYKTLSELSVIYGNPDFFLLPAIRTRPKNPPNLVQQKDRIPNLLARPKSPMREVQEPFALAEDDDVSGQPSSLFDDAFQRKSNIASAIKQSAARDLSHSNVSERSTFGQSSFDPFGNTFASDKIESEGPRETPFDWKRTAPSRVSDFLTSNPTEPFAAVSSSSWGQQARETPERSYGGSRFPFTQTHTQTPAPSNQNDSRLAGLSLNDSHYDKLLAKQRQIQLDRETELMSALAKPSSHTGEQLSSSLPRERYAEETQSLLASVASSRPMSTPHQPKLTESYRPPLTNWMQFTEDRIASKESSQVSTIATASPTVSGMISPTQILKSPTRTRSPDHLAAEAKPSSPVQPTLLTHGLHNIEGPSTHPVINPMSPSNTLAAPSAHRSYVSPTEPVSVKSPEESDVTSKWNTPTWEQPKEEKKLPSLRELQELEAAETRKRQQALAAAHQQAQFQAEQQAAATKAAEPTLSWASNTNSASPAPGWGSRVASTGRSKTLAEIQKEQQQAAKEQSKAASAGVASSNMMPVASGPPSIPSGWAGIAAKRASPSVNVGIPIRNASLATAPSLVKSASPAPGAAAMTNKVAPGIVRKVPAPDQKGPSEDFMKWARGQLKSLLSVNVNEFVALLLTIEDASMITEVINETLGPESNVDAYKFGQEFLRRRQTEAAGSAPYLIKTLRAPPPESQQFVTVGKKQKKKKDKADGPAF